MSISERIERVKATRSQLGDASLVPLAVLVGLAAVQTFDLNAFGVLSPDIRKTFHLSQAGIDSVASLTGALPIIFAVALGFVGDRGNRVRLSKALGVLWAITAVATGLAPVVAVLVIARILGGVGLLSAETIYPSLISDFYPPEGLGTAFSWYRFGSQGVGLIGLPLAGGIAAVAGWRSAFVVLALPTFALVACMYLVKEPARGASAGLTASGGAVSQPTISEGFRRIKAIKTLRRTWMSAFLFGAGTLPFATVINNFLKDVYHLGDSARGGVSTLLGVGGLVGVAFGGWLTARTMGRRRPDGLPVITGGLIISFGVFSLIVSVIPNLGASLAVIGFVTIGAFGFLPAYTTMVSLVTAPNLRSQAYGWSLFFYGLGAIVITPIIGGIADAHGQRVSLAVLAFVVMGGGAIGMTVRRFVAADFEAALRAEAAVSSGMMLSLRNVDAAYGGVQVLFGVDVEIEPGEIVALLGTNGAGKSTVLKTITGLLDPIGGTIAFEGRDITHSDPIATAKAGIVQVPGGRGVFPTLTVAENLRMAGWLTRKDKAYVEGAIARALDYFPRLAERYETQAGSLSGGEQQMLSLAQAFIAQPKLLLIDELSLGLAPTIVKQLIGIVKAIHDSGTTVVIVEQSVNTALQLAERAVFMEKGEVRFTGPTAELLDRPDILRAVFLGGAASGMSDPARRNGKARKISEESPVVLETRDVTVSYGGIRAVSGVDMQLRHGEILGFLGPNGAGKTTLFDLVSGFTKPQQGRILFAGQDVTDWPAHRRARAGLGRSFQDARLWPGLTVKESLAVALHEEAEIKSAAAAMLGPPQIATSEAHLDQEVEHLIELMGLGAFRDKFVSELSTGSRRMVELAAIVARRPKVILLDEPSSGIAQRETEALGPLIRRIRDELDCSIMIIEHDIPLISSVTDRMIAMELGAVITEGDPKDVLENPQVVESYLGGKLETPAGTKPRRKTASKRSRTNGAADGDPTTEMEITPAGRRR